MTNLKDKPFALLGVHIGGLDTEQLKEVMEKEFPDIRVLGPDYNLDDPNRAAQQTAAVIEQNPDLAGVFGTNVFSAQGAGNAVVNAGLGGEVQVVAYDATKDAIESLNKGDVTLVLAERVTGLPLASCPGTVTLTTPVPGRSPVISSWELPSVWTVA